MYGRFLQSAPLAGERIRPADLLELLSRTTWRADVLGRLLGCSESEAEALLVGRGFTYDASDERWHLWISPDVLYVTRVWRLAMERGFVDPDDEQFLPHFQHQLEENLKEEQGPFLSPD